MPHQHGNGDHFAGFWYMYTNCCSSIVLKKVCFLHEKKTMIRINYLFKFVETHWKMKMYDGTRSQKKKWELKTEISVKFIRNRNKLCTGLIDWNPSSYCIFTMRYSFRVSFVIRFPRLLCTLFLSFWRTRKIFSAFRAPFTEAKKIWKSVLQ